MGPVGALRPGLESMGVRWEEWDLWLDPWGRAFRWTAERPESVAHYVRLWGRAMLQAEAQRRPGLMGLAPVVRPGVVSGPGAAWDRDAVSSVIGEYWASQDRTLLRIALSDGVVGGHRRAIMGRGEPYCPCGALDTNPHRLWECTLGREILGKEVTEGTLGST